MLMSLGDPLGMDSDVEIRNSWDTKYLKAFIMRCSGVSPQISAWVQSKLGTYLVSKIIHLLFTRLKLAIMGSKDTHESN